MSELVDNFSETKRVVQPITFNNVKEDNYAVYMHRNQENNKIYFGNKIDFPHGKGILMIKHKVN